MYSRCDRRAERRMAELCLHYEYNGNSDPLWSNKIFQLPTYLLRQKGSLPTSFFIICEKLHIYLNFELFFYWTFPTSHKTNNEWSVGTSTCNIIQKINRENPRHYFVPHFYTTACPPSSLLYLYFHSFYATLYFFR